MQSIAIVILGIIGMMFGWFVYSKFIASRIFKLDDSFVTPAHTEQDGVDFVPTNKVVLWGHHFTSVAGAAPIVGPAIAVYWGWVPAVLWVVFGTILFAGVHDMGALWATLVVYDCHLPGIAYGECGIWCGDRQFLRFTAQCCISCMDGHSRCLSYWAIVKT